MSVNDVSVPLGQRRRTELGEFLKTRRAQLRPADVGLPPGGGRRRTAGLRREELALLAGVGVTWYTWLEQGRPINVSTQVLEAVARTLQLDQAERAHLYQLAEATPRRAAVDTTTIPDGVHEVLRALDPLPAILINTRYDVLTSNEAHEDLFWEWHSLPCVHRNLIWCNVTEPTARGQMNNYDEHIRYLVARMRADYAHHIGDPDWEEDINRLIELSDEFAELWARHEVAEAQTRLRAFVHPAAGEIRFTATELAVLEVPDLRILAYTPCDEQSWTRLPLTRRQRATTSGT
ncbi:MAG TPA: helix-turn-helix transcriptional regulator [Pseudonocardiaceae bacterium]|jgi:transcriptional regulator with XRE-family HTH domain|nr:helix-turn-helix transcriptional regulator [Pseudonocardiaceae bacterium]